MPASGRDRPRAEAAARRPRRAPPGDAAQAVADAVRRLREENDRDQAPPAPDSPFAAFAQACAQWDSLRRMQGAMLDRVGLGPIVTPSQVALWRAGVMLRRYPCRTGGGPVLLIVPAPIKRAYIWDLSPTASVVRRCLDAGMRVYLAEWCEPGPRGKGFGFADYADRLIGECLDAIAAETGEARPALAGHSLGGTLAAIFAALNPARVGRLVLIEAPLHYGRDGGALVPVVTATPAGATAPELESVPGSFLNLLAVSASPQSFEWARWRDFFESLRDRDAIETHMRVERWAMDELPLPCGLFADVAQRLYREDALMRGTLEIGGRVAAPASVAAPILSVLNPASDVVPLASVLPFLAAAPSDDKPVLRYDAESGVALQHVGPLVGRNAQRFLWPRIIRWLRGGPERGDAIGATAPAAGSAAAARSPEA